MGAKEWEPSLVLDVFGDSLSRDILVVATDSPISAASLAERFDVSPPTVYKRLNHLLEYDLLQEHHRVDEDGTHFRVFESSLRRVVIEVEGSGYTVDVEFHRDLDDRFERFWTELMASGQLERSGPEEYVPRPGRKNDSTSL